MRFRRINAIACSRPARTQALPHRYLPISLRTGFAPPRICKGESGRGPAAVCLVAASLICESEATLAGRIVRRTPWEQKLPTDQFRQWSSDLTCSATGKLKAFMSDMILLTSSRCPGSRSLIITCKSLCFPCAAKGDFEFRFLFGGCRASHPTNLLKAMDRLMNQGCSFLRTLEHEVYDAAFFSFV